MGHFIATLLLLSASAAFAGDLPLRYVDLLPYVQTAPDQGETNTCLFVGSTGAMELIANKKAGITNPLPYGPFDLSESFLIHAPPYDVRGKNFLEKPILRFNHGFGIHLSQWPYEAWKDTEPNQSVWRYRDWSKMQKTALPKVQTIPLFMIGNRWSTGVLQRSHVQQIKEALWTHKSPVLVNYNDGGYWHVVVIVGYDDDLPGACYDNIPADECAHDLGSFYVRDSFGMSVEVRDYDWFRIKGNAAIVVKEVP